MTIVVVNINEKEEQLLKEINCGTNNLIANNMDMPELPVLEKVIDKMCCGLNGKPTQVWTLQEIVKSWKSCYGENMRTEYSGFIDTLKEIKQNPADIIKR